jgi:hypothetical protein
MKEKERKKERKKKSVTALVWKCIVTELSERIFTECTLTRPDCQNCTNITKKLDNSVIMNFLCNL